MVFTAPVHKDRENSLFWKGEMGEDEDQSKTHTMCRNSKSWFSVGSMSGFVWDALHSKHLLYSSPSALHRSRHSLFLKWCLFCARSYLRWLRLHFYNSHKGILGLLGRDSNPVSHGLTSQILRDYREKKNSTNVSCIIHACKTIIMWTMLPSFAASRIVPTSVDCSSILFVHISLCN